MRDIGFYDIAPCFSAQDSYAAFYHTRQEETGAFLEVHMEEFGKKQGQGTYLTFSLKGI